MMQRGTDQQHTKSRGKPWQHHSYKEQHNNNEEAVKHGKSRERLCLSFYSRWRHRAQQSKFFFFTALQQTHKHEGDKKLLYIVKCVCLRTHAHSDTHTHIQQDVKSAVLGVTKTGVLGFFAARAENTNMKVLRCF